MGNLRKSLIILFQEQNPTKMLKRYLDKFEKIKKDDKLTKLLRKEEFISLFNSNHKKLYNKDEVKNICKILEGEWTTLEYASGKSILNIVAKFSTEVLKESNNEPVCQHENLFKWREVTLKLGEDIFTTAFLAYNDIITGRKRDFFTWRSIIKTDNVRLEQILKKGIAENHFHLNGSSPHFQLSWISLMNQIVGREKDFKNLKKEENLYLIKHLSYDEETESIESLVRKAAAIRVFLFSKFIIKEVKKEESFSDFYKKMNFMGNDLEAGKIQTKIDIFKYFWGKKIDETVPDYIIHKNITENNYRTKEEYNGSVLLYGERYFLYNLFKLTFDGDKEFEEYIDLFYIYLCIKQKLRSEIIQINDVVGFANFSDYQNRKEIFLPEDSIYHKAVVNIAINSSMVEQNIKYLETRIAPKKDEKKLHEAILKIESKSKDTCFFKKRTLADEILESKKVEENGNKYFHTIHFIKTEENEKLQAGLLGDVYPRNYKLREKLKKEANVINNLRKSTNETAKKIYGIDAANIEIGCRPEVFAQTFRFLKNYRFQNPATILGIDYFKEIGQTFHVGEDFLDLLDGLRAIDEVLEFLNFSQGDRLGHALALGIEPERYYQDKEYTIILPKQDFLDNIAWALYKKNEYNIDISSSFYAKLENLFKRYYNELYIENLENSSLKDLKFVTYREYFEAWRLRGDDPNPYLKISDNAELNTISYSFWDKCRFNENKNAVQARKEIIAQKLYKEYHYNSKIKEIGRERMEYKIEDREYIKLVKQIQDAIQREVARKNIFIETNPSSNYLIGPIEKYIKHPILRFNNFGLENNENSYHLSVSINTDDQGVFSTSLENEYALVVLALLKERDKDGNYKYNPTLIYNWIDRIREMSLEHSFENIYG